MRPGGAATSSRELQPAQLALHGGRVPGRAGGRAAARAGGHAEGGQAEVGGGNPGYRGCAGIQSDFKPATETEKLTNQRPLYWTLHRPCVGYDKWCWVAAFFTVAGYLGKVGSRDW